MVQHQLCIAEWNQFLSISSFWRASWQLLINLLAIVLVNHFAKRTLAQALWALGHACLDVVQKAPVDFLLLLRARNCWIGESSNDNIASWCRMEKILEEKLDLRSWSSLLFVFVVGKSPRLSCAAGNSKLYFRTLRALLLWCLIYFWCRTDERYWKPWCLHNSWILQFLLENWAPGLCHVAIHAKVGNSTTRKLRPLENSSSTFSIHNSNFLTIAISLVNSKAPQQLH